MKQPTPPINHRFSLTRGEREDGARCARSGSRPVGIWNSEAGAHHNELDEDPWHAKPYHPATLAGCLAELDRSDLLADIDRQDRATEVDHLLDEIRVLEELQAIEALSEALSGPLVTLSTSLSEYLAHQAAFEQEAVGEALNGLHALTRELLELSANPVLLGEASRAAGLLRPNLLLESALYRLYARFYAVDANFENYSFSSWLRSIGRSFADQNARLRLLLNRTQICATHTNYLSKHRPKARSSCYGSASDDEDLLDVFPQIKGKTNHPGETRNDLLGVFPRSRGNASQPGETHEPTERSIRSNAQGRQSDNLRYGTSSLAADSRCRRWLRSRRVERPQQPN